MEGTTNYVMKEEQIELTLVKKLAMKIATFEIIKIKIILWRLCYEPYEFFEECGFTSKINPAELIEEILKACASKEGFDFGLETRNSYGVRIKTRNTVVRDTILEHCEKVAQEPTVLRECINKICTKPTNYGYTYRRRSAFEALGFSEKEQKFLENHMDTYCIGELLKAIQKEKYPKQVPIKESDLTENGESVKLDSKALIENECLIKEFLLSFKGLGMTNVTFIMKNLETITPVIEKAKEIKNRGLDPAALSTKHVAVEQLFASMNCL